MTQLIKNDLIAYFQAACKPKDRWRIGTEHEVFLYNKNTNRRLPYEGENGIRSILEAFCETGSWVPIHESGQIIAARSTKSLKYLTLEPGGQFELSGAPVQTLHETAAELTEHLSDLESILQKKNAFFLAKGFDPYSARDEVPWMPKARYEIMKAHMSLKGNLGLDMMLRTCTVQANLDFESEEDMVIKFRIAMALQPLITALFANSSIIQQKETAFASYRAHVWQDTDPERCGFLKFVFDPDMGFERYVDYLLTVPMYFLYRSGQYLPAAGESFTAFMRGELPNHYAIHPTLDDWTDHTTVAFPEVRLKRYLEMRGADVVPMPYMLALPALWVGLLYDRIAQSDIYSIIQSWSLQSMVACYQNAPHQGLSTVLEGQTLKKWWQEILPIAYSGLARRSFLSAELKDESIYLSCLEEKM